MLKYFRELFSLEERKTSTIVVSFIAFCIVGIYMIINVGDMSGNLTTTILTLAGIIGGVNSIPYIGGIMQSSKKTTETIEPQPENLSNTTTNNINNNQPPVSPNSSGDNCGV